MLPMLVMCICGIFATVKCIAGHPLGACSTHCDDPPNLILHAIFLNFQLKLEAICTKLKICPKCNSNTVGDEFLRHIYLHVVFLR